MDPVSITERDDTNFGYPYSLVGNLRAQTDGDISRHRGNEDDPVPSDSIHSSTTADLTIESVSDMLNCFICFKKVRDAVICPYCSKFSCEPCLKAWIGEKKQECPACRHALTLSQIVKCRFLTDFSKVLESIKPQLLTNFKAQETNDTVDKCTEHSMKMQYFCQTCSRVICSDCVMFTKSHEGHKFERIRAVYEKRVDQLNREMSLIKRKIDEYDLYVMHLVKQSEALKKAKDDKAKDLLGIYRTLNLHLDTELNNRLVRIDDEKRKVEEDLEYFESIHQDMHNQLKHLTPAKVISRSAEFLKMLADINSKKFNPSVPKTIVSDFGNSISIRPAVGCFVLKPYSIYKNSNEIVYSDPLIADGITWRIKIYPNGTGAYKNIYLSLFVEMVKGWSQMGSYCYKITLVKPERESENVEREYVSEFENSICWGYNRFIKIEDLENQGFLDREKDQFTLRYHIRPAHHLQKISDQSEYISYLEQSVQKEKGYSRKLKQRVKMLEKISEKESEESTALQISSARKPDAGEPKALPTEGFSASIDQPKEEEERASVESGEFEENSKDKNGIVDSE